MKSVLLHNLVLLCINIELHKKILIDFYNVFFYYILKKNTLILQVLNGYLMHGDSKIKL